MAESFGQLAPSPAEKVSTERLESRDLIKFFTEEIEADKNFKKLVLENKFDLSFDNFKAIDFKKKKSYSDLKSSIDSLNFSVEYWFKHEDSKALPVNLYQLGIIYFNNQLYLDLASSFNKDKSRGGRVIRDKNIIFRNMLIANQMQRFFYNQIRPEQGFHQAFWTILWKVMDFWGSKIGEKTGLGIDKEAIFKGLATNILGLSSFIDQEESFFEDTKRGTEWHSYHAPLRTDLEKKVDLIFFDREIKPNDSGEGIKNIKFVQIKSKQAARDNVIEKRKRELFDEDLWAFESMENYSHKLKQAVSGFLKPEIDIIWAEVEVDMEKVNNVFNTARRQRR